MGAAGYGALGVAFALVSYLLVTVDLGLDPFAVQRVARDPAGLPSLLPQVVKLRLAASLGAYALLGVLTSILPSQVVGGKELALIYGGRLFSAALKANWALRGRDEMGQVAAGMLLQNLLYAAGIFALVRCPEPSAIRVPILFMAGEAVLVLWYLGRLKAAYPRLWGAPAQNGIAATLLRDSLPVAASKTLRLGFHEGDLLLLAWLSTAAQAGFFLVGHRIVTALASVALLFQQSAFPSLSRLSEDRVGRSLDFQRSVSRGILLCFMPPIVTGAVLGDPLVRLLFGEEFAPAGAILSISLAAVPLLALSAGLHNCLLARGRPRAVLAATGAGTLVHLLLGLAWIPDSGGLGAARALVCGEAVVLVLSSLLVWKRWRVLAVDAATLWILAASGLMAAILWQSEGIWLGWRLLLGLGAYLAAVLFSGALRPHELRRLLEG